MATPPQPDLKALDQTRQRLLQLTTALNSLRRDLEINDPLPSWPAIQQSTTFITSQLQAIHNHLARNRAVLSSIHAYPLPSFPGRAHETLVGALLRKKLEPGVEDWVGEGRKVAEEVGVGGGGGGGGGRGGAYEELENLWEWAAPRAVQIYEGMPAGVDFTIEEMRGGTESVRTGIGRRLNGGAEEEEEEYEEEEEVVEEDGEDGEEEGHGGLGGRTDVGTEQGKTQSEPRPPATPMMALDDVLRFMAIGAMPSSKGVATVPALFGPSR